MRNNLLAIVATVLPLFITNAATADKPNIVFILADDMSWYGIETQMQRGFKTSAGLTRRTPSINALARQGMTFSRAFAPTGICAPSRCSIQTGMTTARTRFSGNGNFGVVPREVAARIAAIMIESHTPTPFWPLEERTGSNKKKAKKPR